MIIRQLFDQDTWTYTYLLADEDSREAVIIDPVIERHDRDFLLISELNLTLLYTLDTHVHADHITGSGKLREATGAKTGLSTISEVNCADVQLNHGDTLQFGAYTLEVRATPGHTNGCLTYVVSTDESTYAFTGDALFIRGCGRTDFQQGSSNTLFNSVHKQIYSLPEDTIIYPGHDYRGHTQSTVAEEKAHNPRLNTRISEAEFVKIMNDLKLADPKKIHEALPANLACGLAKNLEGEPVTKTIRQVDASSLAHKADSWILDVRTTDEFERDSRRLINVISAPLDELPDIAAKWNRSQELVLVCQSGRRSTKACEMLTQMGFSNVANLTGGMNAVYDLQER